MNIIAEALSAANSSIKKLDISQTGITADSLRNIFVSMRTNHHLQTLIIDNNNLNTSYSFHAIQHIIASANTLRVLSCANCNLSDTFGT